MSKRVFDDIWVQNLRLQTGEQMLLKSSSRDKQVIRADADASVSVH
jgi:hypothetical protein